jgi:hypothetical protein
MIGYDEWTQAEGQTLARFVYTDLPDAFQLPASVDRQKLLASEDGPQKVASELYEVLREQEINYVLSPYHLAPGTGQRLRKPGLILKEQRATCIDLSLLFAGMCLANDLLPLVVIIEGHAFVGVRADKTIHDNPPQPIEHAFNAQGMLTDLELLRELSAYYIWIETTGATRAIETIPEAFPEGRGRSKRGLMTFSRALEAGSEQVDQLRAESDPPSDTTRALRFALDIYDLQVHKGVRPTDDAKENGHRTIIQGNQTTIQGNQTNISGPVEGPVLSGAFNGPVTVGPTRIVKTDGGDYAEGNITKGDSITVGNITGSTGVAIGRNARATVVQNPLTDELARKFSELYERIQRGSEPDPIKNVVAQQVQAIETEVKKDEQADPKGIESGLTVLQRMAPEVFEMAVAFLASPISGITSIVRRVAERFVRK